MIEHVHKLRGQRLTLPRPNLMNSIGHESNPRNRDIINLNSIGRVDIKDERA